MKKNRLYIALAILLVLLLVWGTSLYLWKKSRVPTISTPVDSSGTVNVLDEQKEKLKEAMSDSWVVTATTKANTGTVQIMNKEHAIPDVTSEQNPPTGKLIEEN